MKKLLVIIMAVLSVNSFASTSEVQILNLYGAYMMIHEGKEIPLSTNNSLFGFVGNKEGLFICIAEADEDHCKDLIQIGDLKENNGGRYLSGNVKVNIIKNKERKVFKASVCSPHMGCFPAPHFESRYKQLIEFYGVDGQVVCYNNDVVSGLDQFSIGKCPQ